jgi:hypothetical protein
MSHTPAPWTVSELYAGGQVSKYHIFIEPNVAVIERKVEGKDQCDMADARLIAAAPDLLDALERLLKHGTFDDYPNTNQWYAVRDARAAIARATGEAS